MPKVDVSKLSNIVRKDGKTVARCPACAARGGDAKGNNLVVFDDGKFGCVAAPKDKDHNRMILQLVGVQEDRSEVYRVPVRRVLHAPPKVVKVVGRFGRSCVTPPPAEPIQKPTHQDISADGLEGTERRPARPAAPQPLPMASKPSTATEGPQRRPSVLDDLLSSLGLQWRTCEGAYATVSEPKKSKKRRSRHTIPIT